MCQLKMFDAQAEQIAREQAAEEFASQKAAWRKERNTFQVPFADNCSPH